MTVGTVFSIPLGSSFVDSLARGILNGFGDANRHASEALILLPTRRACRSLAMACLRQSGGSPLILPRMDAIGDVDEDELSLELDLNDTAVLDWPPPISPLRRQMLLGKLIRAGQPSMAMDQAVRLGAELGKLLDQVQTAGVDFSKLKALVPENLAAHWQVTVDFLQIIVEAWPRILADEGRSDPAAYRNKLLAARTESWRRSLPTMPVIAAGSTGSIPATADLLTVVSGLPNGALVLPGLDTETDDETWEAIKKEPGHPQFGMACLLSQLGVARSRVRVWPGALPAEGTTQRVGIIQEALQPTSCVDFTAVRQLAAASNNLSGMHRIDAPGADEEARVIALIMRSVLEHPGKTAALVTPDRLLARRVVAEMKRWAIDIDDSGGEPLSNTLPGTFLRAIARAAADRFAPISMLALLKHPLTAVGQARPVFLARVRHLEKAVLRGALPTSGFDGLRGTVSRQMPPSLDRLLDLVENACGPIVRVLENPTTTVAALIIALVDVAEALAATDNERGSNRIWSGNAGEAAAAFIADVAASASPLGAISGSTFPALLEALMAGHVVRPKHSSHPRLAIWGPLEARLQHADVMILGGLNEDVWPPSARPNPWMSRPMMRAFGLPLPERRIGLSAHDFVQACAAPEVWLTRSEKRDGAPTGPSRWLLRLEAALDRTAWQRDNAVISRQWLAWQDQMDAPVGPAEPVDRPAPCPPVGLRPRRLSVTEIETWMRDPYAIYARHILRLKPLEDLEAAPEAAERGSFIHRALDEFIRHFPEHLPAEPLGELLSFGEAALGPLKDHPNVRAFWWPRFEKIAHWFIAIEKERRPELRRSVGEIKGHTTFLGREKPFELHAKADRIDVGNRGTLEIIDYKTGAVPKPDEVRLGFSPQLALEAVIAEDGGFPDVRSELPASLEYWELKGDESRNKRRTAAGKDTSPDVLAADARTGLQRLIDAYDDPETTYPSRPDARYAPRYSDYAHLARVKEWSGGGEEDET